MLHFLSLLVIYLSIGQYVHATEACHECRSISLQEAPGIGLSLTPGHGAASIYFANGTVSDIILVTGTTAYIQAMKHWEHPNQISGEPSVSTSPGRPNLDTHSTLPNFRFLRPWLPLSSHSPWTKVPSPPASSKYENYTLFPIAEMLKGLYQEVTYSISPLYNKVFLSLPDFVLPADYDSYRHIDLLLDAAGLEGFYNSYVTQSEASLAHLYNLDDCYGIPVDELGLFTIPNTECEKYQDRPIQSVMAIHLDESSLSLRSMIRDYGIFDPNVDAKELLWVQENGFENTEQWAWLDHEIRRFIAEQTDVNPDLLLLSGNRVMSPEFQDVVRDVFRGNRNISSQDYLHSQTIHAFAAARAAAVRAKIGMCRDFNACLPQPSCLQSKYCEKWAG